jgi:hypothetical protein
VRRAMAPISRIAREADIAVIGVMHLNRRDTTTAAARISGSPAFRNAARSVLMFGVDPADPRGSEGPGRVVAQEKANLTRPGLRSLACRVEGVEVTSSDGQVISTSRIVFLGQSTATASEIIEARQPKVDGAERFLRDRLAQGPCRAGELEREADENGFTKQNLRTARGRIGVTTQKRGGRSDGWWEWNLPDVSRSSSTPSLLRD